MRRIKKITLKYLTTCESFAIVNFSSNPGSIDGITMIERQVTTINAIKTSGRVYLKFKYTYKDLTLTILLLKRDLILPG